jgi:hypothetical protein
MGIACVLEPVPAEIRIALRHHAGKWSRDFRIIKQALVVSQFRHDRGELALGCFQRCLAGVHLRGCRQIPPLRVVDLLLGDDSGLALEYVI